MDTGQQEIQFAITLPSGKAHSGKAFSFEIKQDIPQQKNVIPFFRIELFGWGEIERPSTCGNACAHVEPYGFVPECGCPIHDAED